MTSAHARHECRHEDERGAIRVTVTFIGAMRRFLPPGADGPQRMTLSHGATIADLLDAVGIPAAMDPTVSLGGALADRGDALRDGAEVLLLGPMEGGSNDAGGSNDSGASRER